MIGIGDLDGKSRDTRHVRTREDHVLYMGKKYRQEASTGYYICTSVDTRGRRRRLHEVVWEHAWEREVPAGCVIHHLNWDKTDNRAENLVCLTVAEHEQVHNIIGGDKGKALGYTLVNERSSDGTPTVSVDEKKV